MSRSRTNGLTKDYSGKFGNQYVLRRKNGLSLMTKLPEKTTAPASPAQIKVQTRFMAGAVYAREAMTDPEKRELYLRKADSKRSAYNLAMADFFKPPKILACDTVDYAGHAGDVIHVQAVDDTCVKRVRAELRDAGNQVLEAGDCIQQGAGLSWFYTVTGEYPQTEGQSLRIEAWDMPGNITELIREM